MSTPLAVLHQSCYSGHLFRRCREKAVGLCQYCGRPFCSRHGDMPEEDQQVCHRRLCRRKVDDLKVHQAYLNLVSLRNAETTCGLAGCRRQPWGQCSHCQGLFCQPHVHRRLRTARRDGLTFHEPVSLCDHCRRRHQLWVQV